MLRDIGLSVRQLTSWSSMRLFVSNNIQVMVMSEDNINSCQECVSRKNLMTCLKDFWGSCQKKNKKVQALYFVMFNMYVHT